MKKTFAEFRLLLHYSIRKDGNYFVISNNALDVVTQGESKEEAVANFREAVTLFVESCYRRGTLYKVLNESGVLFPVDAEQPEEDPIEILMPLTTREETGVENHPH